MPVVFWGLVVIGIIVLAFIFFTSGQPSSQQVTESQNIKRYAGAEYTTERQSLCEHLSLNPDVDSATQEVEDDNVLITVNLRRDYDDNRVQVLAERIQHYLSANYAGERSDIVGEIEIDAPSGLVHRAYVMTGVHDTFSSNDNPTVPAVHDTSWTVKMGADPVGKS